MAIFYSPVPLKKILFLLVMKYIDIYYKKLGMVCKARICIFGYDLEVRKIVFTVLPGYFFLVR